MPKKPTRQPPVEVVRDPKTGVEAVVYYDREKHVFYCDVPQLGRAVGPDLRAVVDELRRKLAAARSFEWKPVIFIAHSGGGGGSERSYGRGRSGYSTEGAHLSFEFWRAELAPKPATKLEKHEAAFVQRPHPLDVEDPDAPPWLRENREKEVDVHDHNPPRGEEVVPYTDEAWQALRRLKAATEATYAQLAELFKKPDLLLTVPSSPPMIMAGGGRRRREGGGG